MIWMDVGIWKQKPWARRWNWKLRGAARRTSAGGCEGKRGLAKPRGLRAPPK